MMRELDLSSDIAEMRARYPHWSNAELEHVARMKRELREDIRRIIAQTIPTGSPRTSLVQASDAEHDAET